MTDLGTTRRRASGPPRTVRPWEAAGSRDWRAASGPPPDPESQRGVSVFDGPTGVNPVPAPTVVIGGVEFPAAELAVLERRRAER